MSAETWQEGLSHPRQSDGPEEAASGLVGAVVGDWYVKARTKPGKRVYYVLHNAKTGAERVMRGDRLVRRIKATAKRGGVVIMPRTPWHNDNNEEEK